MFDPTRSLFASALVAATAGLALWLAPADGAQDPVGQGLASQNPAAQNPVAEAAAKEKQAVMRAGLDYIEALYEAKPERIERSVHPELRKYGFYRRPGNKAYKGSAMTFEQLVKLAGSWNESGERANADSVKKVEVLDLLDQTAAVKVTAVWGVDYMQLAKFDGKWQIRHILWQSHPAR